MTPNRCNMVTRQILMMRLGDEWSLKMVNRKELEAAEKAEVIQNVTALMIPLSLFLACVVMAAGTFLIYHGESIGWAFAAVSATMVIGAFTALIRFQNKYRARGIIRSNSEEAKPNAEEEHLIFDPEVVGVGTTPKPAQSQVVSTARPTATIVR
jgi:hypothetical protein